MQIELESKLVSLRYDSAIQMLEQKKAAEGISDATRQAIQNEIDRLNIRKQNLPGLVAGAIENVIQVKNPVQMQADSINKELITLTSLSYQTMQAANAIGSAFGQSFKGIIDGSMSAQDALASFFQGVANHFLDMATQIIAKWIEMAILNTVLSLFPGGGGAMGGMDKAAGGLVNPGYGGGFMPPSNILGNANGNAFGANGIIPFAKGGIVSSPTLFKFANGAAMRAGVMGEAGPEAILPLSRGPGGRLGVEASGAGGGSVNVTVNVDATGSKVSGDDAQLNQFGRLIGAAVQSEIVKQKRPGGLLAQ